MKGNVFEGQITITDYLESIGAKAISVEASLPSGKVVYLVEHCDILKFEVFGYFDIEGISSVVLIAHEGSEEPFINIPVSELESVWFMTEEAAENQVLKKLEEFDCILASDMKILCFKAYTSKSKYGEMLTAFFAQLDNGYIYMKDYYSCGHLLKCSVNEAEALLHNSVDNYISESKESHQAPKLKNMYRTDSAFAGNWQYAERSSLLLAQ